MLLDFHDLTRYEFDVVLLRAATGTIAQGDRIALTGSSGSGKSVLMRVLAGIEPLQAGELRFRGLSYHTYTPMIWHQHVALIRQTALMVEGTVEDNLRLPLLFKHYRGRHFDAAFHLRYLKMLGKSENFLKQNAARLSGGERQLVNLLRALQLSPEVLLLDEPTAALDPESKAQTEELIADWHSKQPHCAYLWISHDGREVALIGRRQWRMHRGELHTDE